MGKLNIDQVAKLAHVSRSVVSRVLNNHPNVSEEAKERVRKVIEKYNYRPNAVARSLATQNTYEVSVLTSKRGDESLGNGYWTLLYLGIFEECIRSGYFVRLSFLSPPEQDDVHNLVLNEHQLEGIICLNEDVTDLVAETVTENRTPIVLVGHNPNHPGFCSVDVDNYSGAYKAVEHLTGLGHKCIGGMFGNQNVQESERRKKGYRDALLEKGIEPGEAFMNTDEYSQQAGYQTMKRWIRDHPEMTAVFCASDMIAMGVLLLLREENIRVPEEFSVIGFDGLPVSQYMIPPLTTISQPIYGKGERAAQMLINQIQKTEKEILHVDLEPELIVRRSTGPVSRRPG